MNKKRIRDLTGQFLSWFASSLTIAVCLGIVIYLFVMGYKQINPHFLLSEPNPSLSEEMSGGISTPVMGTFLLTLIGIMLALPWALATAIYLVEYSKKNLLTSYFRLGIDVLAGVPTIVVAIFGLAIFSNPKLGFLSSMVEGTGSNKAFGRSFLIAGITMAIMVIPYIIKTCEEAIKTVPDSYREGSLSMGASKWHTITKIVLPSAKGGILTGVILGMGRIIGDTAIVWLTLGGTIRMTGTQPWWLHWFGSGGTLRNTGSTLTSYIYYASPAGEGNATGKAFGASFVLIVIIIVLNLLVSLFNRSRKISEED